MKKFIVCCLLIVFLPVLFCAFGAGLESGLEAYERGDFKGALLYLRPLAQDGNAKAQFLLGKMYDNGQGVAGDYKRAMHWYEKSADNGYGPAQFALGMVLHCGLNGVRRDTDRGIKLFIKAAEQGHALAMVNLAVAYYQGEGVQKDPLMVFVWSSLGASFGNGQARRFRDKIEQKLSHAQIKKAQEMIANWKECHATVCRRGDISAA